MKKLVKESLFEGKRSAEREVKRFFSDYHNQIRVLGEWVNKMEEIFKDYLPFDPNNEDAISDCQNIWWLEVVEPGWEVPTIQEKFSDEIYDTDAYQEFSDKIVDEALEKLGLPREIVE